jgi:hypothetical protein
MAVTMEQSGPSAAATPRKPRKLPLRVYDVSNMEEPAVPKQSPKKQKTKVTELKAKPASEGKETLRKTLGISKEEARKLAKHHMSMASKLMEDTDEE